MRIKPSSLKNLKNLLLSFLVVPAVAGKTVRIVDESACSIANQLFANFIPNYAGFLLAKTWLHIAGWIF